MFAWLKRRRREKVLRTHPIPDAEWGELLEQHPILDGLDEGQQIRLRGLTTIFLAEKQFELTRGLRLDDFQKASLAVQACLPILNLGLDWYDDWATLILTPEEFENVREEQDGLLRHEDDEELSGQVMELGPVILSWKDVEDSGWGDGYNVVIHEMAHKIDLRNGEYDGCPPLSRDLDQNEWQNTFTEAYKDLRRKTRRLGRRSDRRLRIDPYATTDPPEFFAVVSETFFERPDYLNKDYPGVYELLSRFYRQDTLARFKKRRNR